MSAHELRRRGAEAETRSEVHAGPPMHRRCPRCAELPDRTEHREGQCATDRRRTLARMRLRQLEDRAEACRELSRIAGEVEAA